MAYTEQDLARVRSAIANGAKVVQIADRQTTFRSLDELLQMERTIASALVTTSRPKQYIVVPGKGL